MTLVLTPGLYADTQDDLRDQQDKQRQVQTDTEHVVRRITTMMRVMQFYSIQSPEKEILREMSGTLSALSKNQMAEVIRQLEDAATAKDEKLSDESREKAYEGHRQVLAALHDIVARFDAVKSLDQAADRMEKHAKQQLELHLQTGQSIRDLVESSKPDLSPTLRLLIAKRMRAHATEMKRQSDNQNDLERDVAILVKQVQQLTPKLSPEQQERIKAMDKLIAQDRLFENLTLVSRKLRIQGYVQRRQEEFKDANDLQWKSAGQLQAISRVLRLPSDILAALKEAREKIDQAIAKQEEIKDEVKTQEEKVNKDEAKNEKEAKDPKEKLKLPGLEPLPLVSPIADKKAQLEKAIQDAMNAEKNAEIAKKQAKVAFDTKDTENLLKPIAKDAAENLAKAETAMKDIKDNLLKNDAKKAAEPQEKATEKLKAAKADIEKMIAAAEKEKTDPLAALNKAIENLDNIIKEQTKTREDTKETVNDKQNVKLPELANQQKELAFKTDDVKNAPLPNKEKVEAALDKAAKEMKAAAKNLDAKKSPEAVAKQDKAIDALKEARNELAEKAAEIEKRRDDIAKLEEAGKKLEDLTKQEKNVAQKAEANAEQPKTDAANKELAKEQANLTPKANDLAKEIDKAAPKAAEKIAESTKNMEAAKKGLDKNEAKPAANEAKEAGKKLDDAQKALQNALNELKGKEIADQTAMQKKDQANTAQQVAKALEETQKAGEAAKEAAKTNKNEPMADAKGDLAKQQAEIAMQADRQKLPEAAKDAAQAAEAIKKGDIPKALESQAKALAQLQEAAKDPAAQKPMPGQAKGAEPTDPKKGNAKAAEAKAPAGEKPMAQAKKDAGEPMAQAKGQPGDTGEGEAKPGQGEGQAPMQLAEKQQALMDATKALAQSQQATQAAQAALAQAQAQAPKAIQPQLEKAAKQLQDAAKQLGEGKPGDAGQAQEQAAKNLGEALDALNQALAQAGQPQAQPGQPQQSAKTEPGQAKEPGQGEGKEPGQGEGKEPGQGEGKEPGQGQAKNQKDGKSNEQNQAKGEGDRQADGKVSNKNSKLNDVNGDGSFLHLPPRQRELIRQAISGNLPPEYANLIQQYYINIARGRPAAGSAPSPMPQR